MTLRPPRNLPPDMLKEKYRELASVLNALENAGEVLDFYQSEDRFEIRGQTGMVDRGPNWKGTWRAE